MAVGMPGHALNGVDQAGLVRVFRFHKHKKTWHKHGSDIIGAGGFGASVALSSNGRTLVVGSPAAKNRKGFAAVFIHNGNAWQPLGSSIIHGFDEDDNCGYAVDISQDGATVAVGCPGLLLDRPGYVFVYSYQDGSWSRLGNALAGPSANSLFGFSVSLGKYGQLLAVGAPGTDGNGSDSGQVQIYSHDSIIGWKDEITGAMVFMN